MARLNQAGMTLLELMVALAIFSISAIAILDTIGSTSQQVAFLENKTLAHWVASNQLDKERERSAWPNIGVRRAEEVMSSRTWYITSRVEATARNDMRRLIVEVRAEQDGVVLSQRDWFFGRLQ
jgi:general secretion pathway protein I